MSVLREHTHVMSKLPPVSIKKMDLLVSAWIVTLNKPMALVTGTLTVVAHLKLIGR